MKVKWIDVGEPEINIREEIYKVTSLPITQMDANSFLKDGNEKEIMKRIEAVIDCEAPITEWLLIKRVINSFGIMKAGIHVRKKMFNILDNMNLNSSEEYDQKIYWRSSQRPKRYKAYRLPNKSEEAARDVTNIPVTEISNVVYQVLIEEENLDYKELMRLSALRLGYTRMGTNVKLNMKRAITMAEERYPIEKKGNIYYAYKGRDMLK